MSPPPRIVRLVPTRAGAYAADTTVSPKASGRGELQDGPDGALGVLERAEMAEAGADLERGVRQAVDDPRAQLRGHRVGLVAADHVDRAADLGEHAPGVVRGAQR